MFHNIIGTTRRVDLPLPWHHMNLQRFFAVSPSRGFETWNMVPPEGRRRVYNYQVERYNKNSRVRSDKQLQSLAYMRARLASLSEEEKRYFGLRERFRQFVKRKLAKGRLPDWEIHVPESVDDSVVCHCRSCGRIHYKGRPRIWWRSKQDESYEVSGRKAAHQFQDIPQHMCDESSNYPTWFIRTLMRYLAFTY
jgi:hypothetical protein